MVKYVTTYQWHLLLITCFIAPGALTVMDVFGENSLPFVLGGVNCSGSERGLLDCPRIQAYDVGCSAYQDAGVVCQGNPVMCSNSYDTVTSQYNCRQLFFNSCALLLFSMFPYQLFHFSFSLLQHISSCYMSSCYQSCVPVV